MTNKLLLFTLFVQLFSAPFANAGSHHGSSSDDHGSSDKSSVSPPYNYVFQFPVPIPPVIKPLRSFNDTNANVTIDFYQLNITSFQAQIYPNLAKTSLVGYNGISPGPIFRVQRGVQSVVRVVNHNDQPSVLHLHGSNSRAVWDGWAEDLIQPGEYKDYYFPNSNTARTLWYHDHANMITSVNLFSGLAGFYIIEDAEVEARLGLPQGKYDIPLALNSKQYTSTGNLTSVAQETSSVYGDIIEVNGQPWPFLAVEPRKYRFRFLNSALSRTFILSIVDSSSGSNVTLPLQVVASDSGFLSTTVTTTELTTAMAERWEVVVDFSGFENRNLTLMNQRNVFDSQDFSETNLVMQFNVGSTVSSNANNNSPPSSLISIASPPTGNLVHRTFKFDKSDDEWVINGVPFTDVKNRVLAAPQSGASEVWVLENHNPYWSHPIHVHLVDFQLISRSGGRNTIEPYEKAALKDIAVLGPEETVTIAVSFAPFSGVYMFHCHNAIHEDHAMMDAFNLTAVQGLGYNASDLIFADPLDAQWRAKSYTGAVVQSSVDDILASFAATGAYKEGVLTEAVNQTSQTSEGGFTYPQSAALIS
ncbi:Cupredoxin [Trichoderma afarasin]